MRIIAKKSLGLILLYIFGAIGGALGAALNFYSSTGNDNKTLDIIMGVMFIVVFIYSVIQMIILIKPPHVIITYEDGVLRFADGLQCAPSELEQVHYRRHSARGLQYSTGTLIVTVKGVEHKYCNISDVVEVQDTLIDLMRSTGEQKSSIH